jgi:nucleotide-binding universal stress UspA family protein
MMYRTILFVVDDDEALPSAVPTVAAYARETRSRVCVVHVQRDGADEPTSGRRRLVTAVVEQQWGSGVDACGEVRVARPGDDAADAVARAAVAAEADLVAITVHGSAGLGAAVLSGVSHRVAAGLDVPVLAQGLGPPSGRPQERARGRGRIGGLEARAGRGREVGACVRIAGPRGARPAGDRRGP